MSTAEDTELKLSSDFDEEEAGFEDDHVEAGEADEGSSYEVPLIVLTSTRRPALQSTLFARLYREWEQARVRAVKGLVVAGTPQAEREALQDQNLLQITVKIVLACLHSVPQTRRTRLSQQAVSRIAGLAWKKFDRKSESPVRFGLAEEFAQRLAQALVDQMRSHVVKGKSSNDFLLKSLAALTLTLVARIG